MLTRTKKAFTLLELIVVIVVLGILAAIAIPTFAAVIEKARQNTAKAAAESLGRDAYALAAFDGTVTGASFDGAMDKVKAEVSPAATYDPTDVSTTTTTAGPDGTLGTTDDVTTTTKTGEGKVTVDGRTFVLALNGSKVTATAA